jgi:pimeloyl-ACP methyl ester carboxylesterase
VSSAKVSNLETLTAECPDLSDTMLTEALYPDLPEWLQEMYPFRTRYLEVDGFRLSFVDEGPPEAAPLVLLHGNPTWSFLYRNLIQRARSQYRVIAPDHMGFGLSDKPVEAGYHTLERHIANFTQLLQALHLRNITLVMHGWGGPVGMGYAMTDPRNIARLVLANTWAFEVPHKKATKLPLGLRIAMSGRVGESLDSLLNLSTQSFLAMHTRGPMGDMVLEAYTYPFASRAREQAPLAGRGGATKAALRAAPLALARMFFEPDQKTKDKLAEIQGSLKAIPAPAVILWGAQDRSLGKLPAYQLRDELKHAREPVFLPEVFHYVPEEAPDALADAVLKDVRPGQGGRAENIFKIIG